MKYHFLVTPVLVSVSVCFGTFVISVFIVDATRAHIKYTERETETEKKSHTLASH